MNKNKQFKVLSIHSNTSSTSFMELERLLNEGWTIERADSPHCAGDVLFWRMNYILSKEKENL